MNEQVSGVDELSLRVVPAEPSDGLPDRVVRLAKALSDPIRVRMLRVMAEGRSCCDLAAIPSQQEPAGICVCEFQDLYGLGQSKASYHLRILKDAGLVLETAVGKWTYYSLNREAARDFLDLVQKHLKL